MILSLPEGLYIFRIIVGQLILTLIMVLSCESIARAEYQELLTGFCAYITVQRLASFLDTALNNPISTVIAITPRSLL